MDRGVVPLASSTHHRGSTYKLCAQPITLRLGSVVLEGAVGLDVKMFEYNSCMELYVK